MASHYLAGSLLYAAWATGQPAIAQAFYQGDWNRLSERVRGNEALLILLMVSTNSATAGGAGSPLTPQYQGFACSALPPSPEIARNRLKAFKSDTQDYHAPHADYSGVT